MKKPGQNDRAFSISGKISRNNLSGILFQKVFGSDKRKKPYF